MLMVPGFMTKRLKSRATSAVYPRQQERAIEHDRVQRIFLLPFRRRRSKLAIHHHSTKQNIAPDHAHRTR